MSEKKLWSSTETLQLIEKFEENRGLWDPVFGRNSVYIKKYKKNILQKLAAEFNTTDIEVGRKLHNLRTQFSQELKKELQCNNSGDVYKSKWQYFDVMKFLQPTVSASINQNSTAASDSSVLFEDDILPPTQSSKKAEAIPPKPQIKKERETPKTVHNTPSKTITKKIHTSHIIEDAYKMLNDSIENLYHTLRKRNGEKDQCDLYVSLLAKKLRKYPERMRYMIMYKIDGLLLENPYPERLPNASTSHSVSFPFAQQICSNQSPQYDPNQSPKNDPFASPKNDPFASPKNGPNLSPKNAPNLSPKYAPNLSPKYTSTIQQCADSSTVYILSSQNSSTSSSPIYLHIPEEEISIQNEVILTTQDKEFIVSEEMNNS